MAPPPEYPFTAGDLAKALPPSLFQRSTVSGLALLGQTIATTSVLLWLLSVSPHPAVTLLLYLPMGFSMYGFLAVGHECAHGSFTASPTLNTVIGSITMCAGLMPYANWRKAHFLHHAHTAHEDDEEYFTYSRESNVVLRVLRTVLAVLPPLGLWVMHMMYLCGARGKNGTLWKDNLYRNAQLDTPLAKINAAMIAAILGAMAVGLVLAPLATLTYAVGPVVACGAVNLLIGYMQHRDADGKLVAFDAKTWSHLRGSLQTIDRSFYPFDWMIHGAAAYHVFHHLFPAAPHAAAPAVMAQLTEILGPHYHSDETSALIAYHPTLKASNLVVDADDTGVLTFVE